MPSRSVKFKPFPVIMLFHAPIAFALLFIITRVATQVGTHSEKCRKLEIFVLWYHYALLPWPIKSSRAKQQIYARQILDFRAANHVATRNEKKKRKREILALWYRYTNCPGQ